MVALTKILHKQVQDVSKGFGKPPPLSEEALKLMQPSHKPEQFIELLAGKKMWHDATMFLAFALPKREAVWWVLQCCKQAIGQAPAPAIANAIQVTEKWVIEPTEQSRRATQAAAEAAEMSSPAGMIALAAFMSGGSIAPDKVREEIYPPEHITPLLLGAAVKSCSVLPKPEKADEKLQQYYLLGVEVATGKSVWKK